AYRQYLSLNPPEDKASAVRAKLAEVEVRQEVATSQEQRASLESHGPGSAGFALSYSPVFRPKAASDLVNDGGISSALGIHAHIGSFYMGVRFGGGDLATTIQAPPPGTDNEATATFSNVTLNSQSFFGADFGFQIGLNELYRSLGPVQLFVPIQSGFAIHTLKAEAVDRSFIGFAWDFATGIGATVYTSSVFNFELTALYHLSPQLVKAHESESQVGVRKLDGSETTSSLGGFELKLGLKLLFGNAD
ncbi:MAG TPA: hypothetical protein VM598_01835, partial [Bdellovibrionota bacterium]|nr:hypothetical protein [Bdellovibrionota bacterium]